MNSDTFFVNWQVICGSDAATDHPVRRVRGLVCTQLLTRTSTVNTVLVQSGCEKVFPVFWTPSPNISPTSPFLQPNVAVSAG